MQYWHSYDDHDARHHMHYECNCQRIHAHALPALQYTWRTRTLSILSVHGAQKHQGVWQRRLQGMHCHQSLLSTMTKIATSCCCISARCGRGHAYITAQLHAYGSSISRTSMVIWHKIVVLPVIAANIVRKYCTSARCSHGYTYVTAQPHIYSAITFRVSIIPKC